jgi:hypothetical protein
VIARSLALPMLAGALLSSGAAAEEPRADETGAPRPAHVVVVAGVAAGVVSGVAFVTGLDVERELSSQRHEQSEADGLILQRTVCAAVAWSTLALGVAGVGGGAAWLLFDDGEQE